MPPVVESQVAGSELERVRPDVETVFESDDHFYSFIRKRDAEVVSYREMRVPIELRPGGRFQYFNPDGGDLGRGGGPTLDKASVKPVFLSENIEYTKLTQWSTDDRRKAVINAVRRLTAGAIVELRRQIDAQLQQPGTGQIGTINVVSTTGGVDTYTLDTAFGARLVRYDQVVQVYDVTLTTLRGKGIITKWDVENKQIDVTPAVAGAVATDVLITDGIANPLALPALFGVPYHHSNASTGTYLGFDRATTPEVRSNRINAGGPLALPFARLAMNKMSNRSGLDATFDPTAWMHPAQSDAYEQIGQLVSVIQKAGGDQKLNMYFGDNQQLAGAPVRTHNNWNKSRIDFINSSVWGRAEILPIGFYTTDGRKIFEIRGASGGVATADIFYMVVGFQTFLTNPGKTAYIDNLSIPAGY